MYVIGKLSRLLTVNYRPLSQSRPRQSSNPRVLRGLLWYHDHLWREYRKMAITGHVGEGRVLLRQCHPDTAVSHVLLDYSLYLYPYFTRVLYTHVPQ